MKNQATHTYAPTARGTKPGQRAKATHGSAASRYKTAVNASDKEIQYTASVPVLSRLAKTMDRVGLVVCAIGLTAQLCISVLVGMFADAIGTGWAIFLFVIGLVLGMTGALVKLILGNIRINMEAELNGIRKHIRGCRRK